MAGEYPYPSDIEADTKSGKILKLFFIITIICLAGELVWLLGIGPFRPFSRIEIIGAENTTKEEILAVAGFAADLTFVTADVNAMEEALAGIASIESVRVFKQLPGRLQIIIQERQPVASAFVSLDGRTVPVLFDNQGVIFQVGGAKKGEFLSSVLPVISGLDICAPYLGEKLPGMYIPLLEDIERLKISNPNLLKMISEIEINQISFDNYDLILYPVHEKIKIRLSDLNEDRLQYNFLLVDLLSDESGIDFFDSRSGIASYIPKEASPE
jgi:cell division septal protein FtsQ